MRVFVSYDGNSMGFLRAIAGGIKNGVYLDAQEIGFDSVGYITTVLADQGYFGVVKVPSAVAMKKQFGGLAIIYGQRKRDKANSDAKTLYIPSDDTEKDRDDAIEKVLEFFKKNKLPSNL